MIASKTWSTMTSDEIDEAVVRLYMDGLTMEGIAAELRSNRNTVATRISFLRGQGVELPKRPVGRPVKSREAIDRLNQLVKQLS